MKKTNLILPLMILLLIILGCGGNRTEKTTRGRIKYVRTQKHNESGSHGWGSWKVANRELYINGERWSPEGYKWRAMGPKCVASPNEAVEAFKCDDHTANTEFTSVLRMNGDAPEYTKVWESRFNSGTTFGEWFGDGRWLLFKNYFYNVETGEKREIKRLPADPLFHFGAVSPDMKTIVYLGVICFDKNEKVVDETYAKVCERRKELDKNRIEIIWLIDADTGDATHLEVSYDKYPCAAHPTVNADDRLKEFQEKIVWEKDGTGRDRLVYPN